MLINWKRSHTLILIGIMALAALLYMGGYQLIIQPKQDDLASLEKQMEQYQKDVQQLKQHDDSTNQALKHVDDQVPAAKRPDAVLEDLRHIASKSDVDIESIVSTSRGDEETGGLKTAGYDLQVSGPGQPKIKDFLDAVETNDRYLRVDAITVDNGGSTDMTLKLTAFYSS